MDESKDNLDTALDDLNLDKNQLVMISVAALVVFIFLIGGLYYWVSKRAKGEVVFPAGVNYLGPQNSAAQPAPMYDFAKLAESSDWVVYKGKIYSFSFQHPKALTPYFFPNDPLDAVTFKTSATPPEQNLLLVVETISKREAKLTGKYEQFVRDYAKFFPGLGSLKSMEPFENEKGLKGYRVNYVTKANVVTSDNYFFVIPGDSDHMLHVNNTFPKEGEAVFKRLLNTLEYKK